MKVGSGSHTYTWHGDWAKLPEGVALGYTHGVAEDRQGRILIHNQSKDAVMFFDQAGNFLHSWGAEFQAGAHGMYLSEEDGTEYLYLSDYVRHLVVKTTLEGEEVFTLRVPDREDLYESEEQYKPTDVAVAPDGTFFVFDGYGQSYIHRYSQSGEYLDSFGGKGSEPGQTTCPHGGLVDLRGNEPVLLVADRGNHRIQSFDLDGRHVGFVTDELRYPCNFRIRGDELLIPDLHGRVTIFDSQNKLIAHLGDQPEVWKQEGWPNLPHEQRHAGLFNSPHMACFDQHGNIYVVEWIHDGRVTKLALD